MKGQFIEPNWHVILLHYPLALLTLGLVVELLAFMWPKGAFRAAGRWMILLGALLLIPTATAGIYAAHDVITSNGHIHGHWIDLKQQASLSQVQWQYLSRHIWLNAGAAGALLLMAVVWIASSTDTRRKLYWPLLVVLLAGVAGIVTSAWYGGELVYRYGTAVNQGGSAMLSTSDQPDHPSRSAEAGELGQQGAEESHHAQRPQGGILQTITYYVPPLQLHLCLAGLAVAFVVGAFGLTLRKMAPTTASTDINDRPSESGFPEDDPLGDRRRLEAQRIAGHGTEQVTIIEPPTIFPGRFWLVASLVGLLTALAGAWAAMGTFNATLFKREWQALTRPDHLRLLVHVSLGVSIIVLPLILAGLVRFIRRHHLASAILSALLLLAIAAQIWIGVLMFFDSNSGPLTGWNKTSAHPAGGSIASSHED